MHLQKHRKCKTQLACLGAICLSTHTHMHTQLLLYSKQLCFYLSRVTRKGLQSRSTSASLLIKNYKCMKEKIKLLFFWLLA